MIAFVIVPIGIVWSLSSVVLSAKATLVTEGVDALQARRQCKKNYRLDINPERLKYEGQRELMHVNIRPEHLPENLQYACGEYLLFEDEYNRMMDGLFREPDQISERWALGGPDIVWAQEVSRARLADHDFRRLAPPA